MKARILLMIWIGLTLIHLLLAAFPMQWLEPVPVEFVSQGEMDALLRQVGRLEQSLRDSEVETELLDPLRAYLATEAARQSGQSEQQRLRFLYILTDLLESVAGEEHSLRLRRCALVPGPDVWPSLVIDGDGSAEAVRILLLDGGNSLGTWTLHDLQLLRIEGNLPWWFIGLMVVNEAALQ